MYKLVDLDPDMCEMVFDYLSFNSHIETQSTSRNEVILIFESEIECNKFHKEYNDLFYKGYIKKC